MMAAACQSSCSHHSCFSLNLNRLELPHMQCKRLLRRNTRLPPAEQRGAMVRSLPSVLHFRTTTITLMIELLCSLRTERHPVIPVVFRTPLMCFGTILFVHLAFMLSIDPVFGPSSLGPSAAPLLDDFVGSAYRAGPTRLYRVRLGSVILGI